MLIGSWELYSSEILSVADATEIEKYLPPLILEEAPGISNGRVR